LSSEGFFGGQSGAREDRAIGALGEQLIRAVLDGDHRHALAISVEGQELGDFIFLDAELYFCSG
jgi:hypothetical protein